MIRALLSLLVAFSAPLAFADTMKFSFKNEDLTDMIGAYSKATGQIFLIDPSVRGKGTITAADAVSREEAFNLLSSALALSGYAIVRQGETMTVKPSRQVQRDLIETTTTLPALKPERMVTYIRTLKHISAETVNRELRILPSKDGEMSVFMPNNQVIISDWTSNLHRLESIFNTIDVPRNPALSKLQEDGRKPAPKTR